MDNHKYQYKNTKGFPVPYHKIRLFHPLMRLSKKKNERKSLTTEDRHQNPDKGRKTKEFDDGRQTTDNGQRTTDTRWRNAYGGRKTKEWLHSSNWTTNIQYWIPLSTESKKSQIIQSHHPFPLSLTLSGICCPLSFVFCPSSFLPSHLKPNLHQHRISILPRNLHPFLLD